MAPDLRTLIDAYATATGHNTAWDAAADLTATHPARLRRSLRHWLRITAELAATDCHQDLLQQAWKDFQATGADNNLDAELADNATTIHTISCAWLAGNRARTELLAAFITLGQHLGILTPTEAADRP